MRLATFTEGGRTRLGLLVGGGLIDIAAHAPDLPGEMAALIGAGAAARAPLDRLAARAPDWPLTAVRLRAPILKPGKILAIGMNYADHIKEMGRELPERQVWFNKLPNTVIGPGEAIPVPRVSAQVDYEAELVVVIGARCRHVAPGRVHEVVFGATCGNDVSVRDWQRATPQWLLGKSFDGHAPMGPALVTREALGDLQALDIACRVNGETRQSSNTREMVFSIADQIALVSQVMTLEPGDVIFTGTPAGVAAGHANPPWLKPGDRVTVEIAGIGVLENPVVAEVA